MVNSAKSLAGAGPRHRRGVREQIVQRLREMVRSGELQAGQRLPSTQALATEWATHVPAVHAALAQLTREGLLERTPRAGTFVRKFEERLTRVGIFASSDLWMRQVGGFYRQLLLLADQELRRRGMEPSLWTDLRPIPQQTEPWPELLRAAHHRDFQGLIVLAIGAGNENWLPALPVPVTFLSLGQELADHVDPLPFVRQGLQELRRQGVREVGLISVMPASTRAPGGNRTEAVGAAAYESFVREAAALEMTTRPEWVQRPETLLGEEEAERFGYAAFNAIWQAPAHPQGLLTYTDIAARGVLLGLLRHHVDVPAELRLVLHRNRECSLLCPVPASFLEVHVSEAATSLVDRLQEQFAGRPSPPIQLAYHLVPFDAQPTQGA